jgi:hypothetical protein
MGVEFYEEKQASSIPTAAGSQPRGGMAASLMSAGLTKSVSGAQIILAAFGVLCLFGTYVVYTVGRDAGAHPPTQAEVQAMADLLRK